MEIFPEKTSGGASHALDANELMETYLSNFKTPDVIEKTKKREIKMIKLGASLAGGRS